MDTLPEEIQSLLMGIFNDVNVTLKMMVLVSKDWHQIVSRYAHKNYINRVLSCNDIARAGYLTVAKWAYFSGYKWNENACQFAAFGGHIEVLKWLDLRKKCGLTTLSSEPTWDRFDPRLDLYGNSNRKDVEVCANAALGGHLEVLKWTREKYFNWDWKTCANAAMNGHLEVLKWARMKYCPWDYRTCEYATNYHHLEVLLWARQNGCQWNHATQTVAEAKWPNLFKN